MKTENKLFVRIVKGQLQIGLGKSDLTESQVQNAKLEKVRTFDIDFAPSTYLEAQKLKSLYSVDPALIEKLLKALKDVDCTTSANRTIARDKLIKLINAKPESFKVNGIELRSHTKTKAEALFLNYGLNYYLTGQPTSSYSVWLKNEGWIPTGRVYHSDYLDLDEVHAIKSFDEVVTVTDEVATPTVAKSKAKAKATATVEAVEALTEQELKQLVDAV